MDYKIVVDSCGELTEEMKNSGLFGTASLSMELGGEVVRDDETFNQAEFLKWVAASPQCPKSSCPSPEEYMERYHCDAKRVYVVTISDKLSGSYNSAELGKKLYKEEYGDKDIHVFDSRTASVGETLIAMKIWECEKRGMSFEKVIETIEEYREEQSTYFVLETLDTLRKNGRLTGIKSIMASALNIKPVMGSTPDGVICQLGQGRGMRRALNKMIEHLVANLKNPEQKILGIAHCNCKKRALEVQAMICEKVKLKGSIITDTRGVSTMYANEGGIIVVV